MPRAILIILLIFLSGLTKGQLPFKDSTLKQKLVLTKEQHQEWFTSLQKLPREEQINFIIQRLLLDTNVFLKFSYPDGIRVDYSLREKTKFQGFAKPTILVTNSGTWFLFDERFTDYFKRIRLTYKFTKLLTNLHFDTIGFSRSTAIYGPYAEYGIILFEISDRKDLRRLKRFHKSF